MLTPADIDAKRFSTTRLKEGYVQEEVDDFLDSVQKDFQFLAAQVARLEEENRTLRRVANAASNAPTAELAIRPDPPSVVAEKLLQAAQTAHDDHVADGKARADEIVREAGGEAARLVEEATKAAERIKSEGLAEKYRRNDELDAKIVKGQQTYNEIKAKADQVRRVASEAVDAYTQEFGS